MNQKDKIKFRSLASKVDAHIRIGKNGVNDNIINEIKKQLLKHKLIKIKFLKSILPINKETIEKIATESSSDIVELKGNVLVLYKR